MVGKSLPFPGDASPPAQRAVHLAEAPDLGDDVTLAQLLHTIEQKTTQLSAGVKAREDHKRRVESLVSLLQNPEQDMDVGSVEALKFKVNQLKDEDDKARATLEQSTQMHSKLKHATDDLGKSIQELSHRLTTDDVDLSRLSALLASHEAREKEEAEVPGPIDFADEECSRVYRSMKLDEHTLAKLCEESYTTVDLLINSNFHDFSERAGCEQGNEQHAVPDRHLSTFTGSIGIKHAFARALATFVTNEIERRRGMNAQVHLRV